MSLDNEKYKIVICIFGCITIEKYRNQIQKIKETYEKNCNENVKILYFLSETKTDYHEENFIYLKGVTDDYQSASYKQQFGLKYIYENYDADFVFVCGTDTFINIPKLLLFVEDFDKCNNLYIGGHGCHRQIEDTVYYYHSGAGFMLSNECLKSLYPFLNDMTDKWCDLCIKSNVQYLIPACDVAISYYLQQFIKNTEIVVFNDLSFISCNHKGYPCHIGQVHFNKIISCHLMSPEDFDDFNNILISNNFFLN